jgi:hypothetical protein
MRRFLFGICACFLCLSVGWSPLAWADAVTDWDANAGKAALDAITEGTPNSQGMVIGRTAAAVILALRVAYGEDTLFLDPDHPQGTMPGEYRFTRTVSEAAGFGVWENARLFALLNMALADGYIGSLETKYYYNYWRPVTAIRLADSDGNPDTTADPRWEPLRPTPPIPDYDSAHAVEGGAAAEVLQRVLKTDQVSFSTCSLTLPLPEEQCGGTNEVLRSYSSFSQAADENGVSRILVGFHFRKSVQEGIQHGRKIGKRAAEHFLKPVN